MWRAGALRLSPPYSGGKGREKRSCWRNSWTTSQGNSSVSSISAARGAMRPRASSRTDPCTISCSSLRRMSTAGSLWSGYLTIVRLWPPSGPEKLGGGDPHRLEDEAGGRGPPQPELAQRAGGAPPGPRRLDEEGADPPRARAPGAGHDQVEVGLATVGDPHLGAVEDVVVAVAHRPGGERGGVAAAPRLAEGEGAEPLAGGEPGEVAPLLVLVAEERDGRPRR